MSARDALRLWTAILFTAVAIVGGFLGVMWLFQHFALPLV